MKKSTKPDSIKLPKWVRILVPTLILGIWFALAGIGGPYFGKISDVATNDQSSFLPASAESTKVNEELKKFQDERTIPAIVVFSNNGEQITDEDVAAIQKATASFESFDETVGRISPPIVSDDGEAALVIVSAESDVAYKTYVEDMNAALESADLSVTYHITGPLGFLSDLGGAFEGIDGLLLGVALAVVFIILLIVYRSPVLPFLVLFNSIFALSAAILVVYYLAKAGIVTINGQVQGILFILVIGAATDYALLYIARYREELARHEKPYQALIASWKRSLEPILAAGGTVIAGLLCLLLSDLNSNKALGPVGAIGIALAVISALTLLPSLLLLWGRAGFWPRIPHYGDRAQEASIEGKGLWPKVARFVKAKARPIWIVSSLVLIVAALGITQLKANGVAQSDLILGESSARDGQTIIDEHFAGGSGTPTYIITSESSSQTVSADIEKDGDVDAVIVQTEAPTSFPFTTAAPKVVDGRVVLEVTLKSPSDSLDAQATVERLRTTVEEVDSSALVGGVAATQLDTRKAAQHDQLVVIPTVLLVITIILMLLLRSILAPLLLLVTTIVSFAATLGISALLFNHVLGFPGADPSIVLFGFIFLVALGIDYNIFLMTRVREESIRTTTRKGVLIGLIVTGGVITSAGIVLASTFAALAVIPILFLAQLAFIVAFGVLLDTIIVRSLLVPALVHDIGKKVWWPVKKID